MPEENKPTYKQKGQSSFNYYYLSSEDILLKFLKEKLNLGISKLQFRIFLVILLSISLV